jgi:hypothetical protein
VDPDWENLTYGDRIANARAAALKAVEPSDILLFWALLWNNDGDCWLSFTGERAWYLIGAIHVDEVLSGGQSYTEATQKNQERAIENTHFWGDRLFVDDAVFIGEPTKSARFKRAVPFVADVQTSSLLHTTYRTARGQKLGDVGGHWSSYTRTCRAVWDLNQKDDRKRAIIVRDAIADLNKYDLLKGL